MPKRRKKMEEGTIQIRWNNGALTIYRLLENAWIIFEANDTADKLSFPFCGTRLILRRDENCISGLRAEVWSSKKFGLQVIGELVGNGGMGDEKGRKR